MTPISATCRQIDPRGKAGYTLLEILFVMALFALMAGLVAPRLTTLYESVKWASERDEVLENIAGLGFLAFNEGKSFEFPPPVSEEDPDSEAQPGAPVSARPPFELPEGWRVTADEPVEYRDNGFCSGGVLRLENQGRLLNVVLRPPLCRPEIQ